MKDNVAALGQLLGQLDELAQQLAEAAGLIAKALVGGHKVLSCGNGGSACDSAHFAAEIAGRYLCDRPGFAAIDLTAEHALITALVNDFAPETVFARRVEALGRRSDVLVVLSTSGRSANVRLALEAAGRMGLKRIALLGHDGGACRGLADVELIVPSDTTARIQEVHQLLYHTICQVLDPILAASDRPDPDC